MPRVKPNGKCFAKYCDECHWWRQREMEDVVNGMPTGIKKIKNICEFEALLSGMHFHMGSLDGLQHGVNESRNRSMETRQRVEDLGSAIASVFQNQERILRLENKKECQ